MPLLGQDGYYPCRSGRFEDFIRHDTRFPGYQRGSEGDHISGIGSSAGKQLVTIDDAVRGIIRIINRVFLLSSRRPLQSVQALNLVISLDVLNVRGIVSSSYNWRFGDKCRREHSSQTFGKSTSLHWLNSTKPCFGLEELTLTQLEKNKGGAEISDLTAMGVPLGLWQLYTVIFPTEIYTCMYTCPEL